MHTATCHHSLRWSNLTIQSAHKHYWVLKPFRLPIMQAFKHRAFITSQVFNLSIRSVILSTVGCSYTQYSFITLAYSCHIKSPMQNILHRSGPRNVACPVLNLSCKKNYTFLIICIRLISGKWTARELNHISTFFLSFFCKSTQSLSEIFRGEIATKKVFSGNALHFNCLTR